VASVVEAIATDEWLAWDEHLTEPGVDVLFVVGAQ